MTRYKKFFYDNYDLYDYESLPNDEELSITAYQSQYFFENMRQLMPRDSTATIVDLGCGRGAFLLWLINEGFTNAIGVDQDTRQVAIAQQRTGFACQITVGDVFSWLSETAEKSVDCFVALDLLEHLTRDELIDFMSLIKSKLADGGSLVARMPNGESPFFGTYQFGDLTHETILNRISIRRLAHASGFAGVETLECKERFRPPLWAVGNLKEMVRYLLHRLGNHFLRSIIIGDGRVIMSRNLIAVLRS